jgi:hypothetical protein
MDFDQLIEGMINKQQLYEEYIILPRATKEPRGDRLLLMPEHVLLCV